MFFNECVVQIGCELWDLTQVFCQNAQFVIMERVDVDGGVGFVGRDIFLLARIDRLSADDGITQRVAAALIVADHAARHAHLLGVDDAVTGGNNARSGRDINAGGAVADGVEEQGIEHVDTLGNDNGLAAALHGGIAAGAVVGKVVPRHLHRLAV